MKLAGEQAAGFCVTELMSDKPLTVVITEEEDQALLKSWRRPIGDGRIRHAAASTAMRHKVSA